MKSHQLVRENERPRNKKNNANPPQKLSWKPKNVEHMYTQYWNLLPLVEYSNCRSEVSRTIKNGIFRFHVTISTGKCRHQWRRGDDTLITKFCERDVTLIRTKVTDRNLTSPMTKKHSVSLFSCQRLDSSNHRDYQVIQNTRKQTSNQKITSKFYSMNQKLNSLNSNKWNT